MVLLYDRTQRTSSTVKRQFAVTTLLRNFWTDLVNKPSFNTMRFLSALRVSELDSAMNSAFISCDRQDLMLIAVYSSILLCVCRAVPRTDTRFQLGGEIQDVKKKGPLHEVHQR